MLFLPPIDRPGTAVINWNNNNNESAGRRKDFIAIESKPMGPSLIESNVAVAAAVVVIRLYSQDEIVLRMVGGNERFRCEFLGTRPELVHNIITNLCESHKSQYSVVECLTGLRTELTGRRLQSRTDLRGVRLSLMPIERKEWKDPCPFLRENRLNQLNLYFVQGP